jgi:hypothetical protein
MVSNDPISEYMQRHGCGFPEALEALAAQLGPPTAQDIRRALQTLGRAGGTARGAGGMERRPDPAGGVTGHGGDDFGPRHDDRGKAHSQLAAAAIMMAATREPVKQRNQGWTPNTASSPSCWR